MSPLVRPLLALATAALLASAHAEDDLLRARLLGPGGTPAACSETTMGARPDKHPSIKKNELPRYHVDPPKNSPKKFEVYMPNSKKNDQALVGQTVLVCDLNNPHNKIDVNPHPHPPNKHSPLTVTCSQGCPHGVEVISDQFVIHQLS